MKHLYKPSALKAPVERALVKAEASYEVAYNDWLRLCQELEQTDKEVVAMLEQYAKDMKDYLELKHQYALRGTVKSVTYGEPNWWQRLLGLNGCATEELGLDIEEPVEPEKPVLPQGYIKSDCLRMPLRCNFKEVYEYKSYYFKQNTSSLGFYTCVRFYKVYRVEDQELRPSKTEVTTLQTLQKRLSLQQDYIQLDEQELALIGLTEEE